MKNITDIILFIVLFCSCTSSGKLSDSKFPYKFVYKEQIGTILPVSAGNYTVMPIINNIPKSYYYIKALVETMPVFLFFLFVFFSGVINLKPTKDEEITLPEEYLNDIP